MSEVYDLVVIGGGPGGYVCAIKAAQMGLKVVCVEKRKELGGTCLNEGCIPSKILLDRSNLYNIAGKKFAQYGIEISKPRINISTLMDHKLKIVSSLVGGIDYLFAKNKIKRLVGTGVLKSSTVVLVKEGSKEALLKAKNIVVATGSLVSSLKGVEVDGDCIISSKEALSLKSAPSSLAVIGAGVIGLELGSVWNRLGSKVTVIEYMDRVAPGMDLEVSSALQKALSSQGIEFKLSTKVNSANTVGSKGVLNIDPGQNFESEKILLAVGRSPFFGDHYLSLKTDSRGCIVVDGNFQTSVKGVFAIGDVIHGPMLAHKAEEEGCAVVDYIVGGKPHVGLIPSVIYTHPEVACVGITEESAKADKINYKVGKFPFSANSRAKVMDDIEGFVKIITDARSDTILGIHIIGPQAGTLIGEAVALMEYGASSEDVALMCHSHPDLNEAIKEAALAAHFKPIHG